MKFLIGLSQRVFGNDKSYRMFIVDIDEITIKNCEKNITMQNIKLGLSKASFGSDFDCLLNAELLKG